METGAFDNYTVQEDPDANFMLFVGLTNCDPKASKIDINIISNNPFFVLQSPLVMSCLRNMSIHDPQLSLMTAISESSAQGVIL